LKAALRHFHLALERVDDELYSAADVKSGELLVREDRLQLRLRHQVVLTLDLEVPVLEAVDFRRKETRDEETLAHVDGTAVRQAQIVLKRALGRIDPVCILDLLRVKLSERVCGGDEVVLDDHLVVNLVLGLNQLALGLLQLKVEQVDILRFDEVPLQVLLHQLHRAVDHRAVCRKAHCTLRVQLVLREEVVEKQLRSHRLRSGGVMGQDAFNFFGVGLVSQVVPNAEDWRVGEDFGQVDETQSTDDVFAAQMRNQ